MKCERCHEREATVHLKSNINGERSERHLCASCARQAEAEGDMSFQHVMDDMLGSIFSNASIFGYPGFAKPTLDAVRNTRVCPVCKETAEEWRRTGKLGCASCYDTFSDSLLPVFQRVQGHTSHIGQPLTASKPETASDEIEALREKQKQAIAAEDYEQAAYLRDRIKALSERQAADTADEKEG